MDNQNITLSIPKDVLRKAKIIAVKRQTSLSRLLTDMVEELVSSDERYEQARERQIKMMQTGFNMGMNGKITWTRDDLHER
ncbi:MAG: CopG family transcriptional regulator [Firmicutes bacterium]|nr:CopG family transcriptional regulator [Bacillota bacterium]